MFENVIGKLQSFPMLLPFSSALLLIVLQFCDLVGPIVLLLHNLLVLELLSRQEDWWKLHRNPVHTTSFFFSSSSSIRLTSHQGSNIATSTKEERVVLIPERSMKIRGFCAQNRLKEQLLFTTNNNNQLIKIQGIVMREQEIVNKFPFLILIRN